MANASRARCRRGKDKACAVKVAGPTWQNSGCPSGGWAGGNTLSIVKIVLIFADQASRNIGVALVAVREEQIARLCSNRDTAAVKDAVLFDRNEITRAGVVAQSLVKKATVTTEGTVGIAGNTRRICFCIAPHSTIVGQTATIGRSIGGGILVGRGACIHTSGGQSIYTIE